MGDTSAEVIDEEFIAEKLLDEQIPGEEALAMEVIDENILDELIVDEEDGFVFDARTESITDYFLNLPSNSLIKKVDMNVDDLKLFKSLFESESRLSNEITKHKILVVGAGGIGCELIKDLVLIGFKDLEVIDLDTIDVSNLNRQFLFRRKHVSQPKAIVARESALEFNPDVNISAYHDSIFSERFGVGYFEQFKLVMNALDNRNARNHVNRLCLAANVPLIETGTSGYHGQVEVIIKGVSQCYECEPKSVQKTFPGCTIRNTPSEPVHCIVWAKHLFNQLFGEEDADNEVSPDSSDPELYNTTENESTKDNGDNDSVEPEVKRLRLDNTTELLTSIVNSGNREVQVNDNRIDSQSPQSPDEITASTKFPTHDRSKPADLKRIVYNNEASETNTPVVLQSPESPDEDSKGIKEILPIREYREMSSNSISSSVTNSVNDLNVRSIRSDGNVERVSTREWARQCGFNPELLHKKFFVDDIIYLLSMKTLWKTRRPPTPSEFVISQLSQDADAVYKGLDRTMKVWDWSMCTKIFANSIKILAERYSALDSGDFLTWDKDDDIALDFVTACANIRSYIFGIPVKSRFDVKAIAGNIIPAIATTNAIVSSIAILHAIRILNNEQDKTTTVHLRKYPNPNGELFLPERNIVPPNPNCYVCASHPEVIIEIDVAHTTVEEFKEIVLKNYLKMLAPDVTMPLKSLILISSEEGETDANNKKLLNELGITDGSILHADDFEQDFEIRIIIKHKERIENETTTPFKIIGNPNVENSVETISSDEPKPGCSKDADSGKSKNDTELDIQTLFTSENFYNSDDDDCCIVDDDNDDISCIDDKSRSSSQLDLRINIDETPKTNGNAVNSSSKNLVTATKHKLDDDSSAAGPTKKLKSDETSSNLR